MPDAWIVYMETRTRGKEGDRRGGVRTNTHRETDAVGK